MHRDADIPVQKNPSILTGKWTKDTDRPSKRTSKWLRKAISPHNKITASSLCWDTTSTWGLLKIKEVNSIMRGEKPITNYRIKVTLMRRDKLQGLTGLAEQGRESVITTHFRCACSEVWGGEITAKHIHINPFYLCTEWRTQTSSVWKVEGRSESRKSGSRCNALNEYSLEALYTFLMPQRST